MTGAALKAFLLRRGLQEAQVERWRNQMLAGLGDLPAPKIPAETQQTSAATSSFLARTLTVIDESLADENFHVGFLAARLAMSRSLLYQRLKEIGQPPPAKLILERRLTRAAELLAHGNGPVSDVAGAVGFGSASHFTYCFRQRFGMAPSLYRSATSLPPCAGPPG